MKKTVLLILLLVSILGIRFCFYYADQKKFLDGEVIQVETILFTAPKIVSAQQRFQVHVGSQSLNVRSSLFPRYSYGDRLRISGEVRRKEIDGKQIFFLVFPQIEIKENTNWFLFVTSYFRQSVVSLFEKNLPVNASSLLLGIVFGIKEGFSDSFYESLSKAGVLHVVAASGMNVAIVAGFLFAFFGKLFRRQVALIISVVGILFYAALAGFEASIVRATLMGIFVFAAQLFGRQALSYYLLFLTAFVMLFVNPSLLYDIGFQLSFFATGGILLLKPVFSKLFSSVPLLFVREDFETTLSSQIATLPILVFNFQTFSPFSLITNILVLWTVPLLMILGGFAAIVGFLFPFLGGFLLWLSYPLLLYFEFMVTLFATYTPDIHIAVSSQAGFLFGISYYLFLGSILILTKRRYGN